MSQQELEQGDLEVMDMVNGHSHPEAAAAAERIAEAAQRPVEDAFFEEAEAKEQELERYWKRKRMEAVLFVAGCLCTAAALVTAWYVPSLLIWVVNAGVLACGIAGAVKIDKYIRWWR